MKDNKQVANKGWIKKIVVATLSLSVLGGTGVVMAKIYEGKEAQKTKEVITQITQNQVQSEENKQEIRETITQINQNQGQLENNKQETVETITQATQNQVQPQESKMITAEKAKQIAFEAAGVKEEQVKYLKVNLEFEDDQYSSNGYVYEIEFIHGGLEYDFKIDSVNQRIIDVDIDSWND